MPLAPYGALFLAAVIVVLAVATIIAAARRGQRCSRCGARVPRSKRQCSACGYQQGQPNPTVIEKEAPELSSAELVAVQGPLANQRFPIPPDGLTLGRQTDNDIVLSDELMVSRHHAVVVIEQGQPVLYDRDSSNGTWVNDQRIFRHVLTPGDRIQIWQSQFVFARPGAPLPSPVPSVAAQPVVHVEGESFAGYVLEGLIGRGGMSEVFRARAQNGQLVAIKILQQTDPYLVGKFMQEGNKIGPLLRDHPNIVYVYEFGKSHDGRLYIVMEYVDAPSLRHLVRRSLDEPEIVSIVGQVCSALAFAHQHNVVHRDIKPENVLVTPAGKAKVLDFGIAKLTSASTVTRDKIVGTPEYISPEQARGEPVRPGSDVYSLGIVLYELLAGSVPFQRPRDEDPYKAAMEVIRQHLKEKPDPLRKRNPNRTVSKKMEQVTFRALRKEIRERYPSAKEMGQALGFKETMQAAISPDHLVSARLVVLQGPRRGLQIALGSGSVNIGRLDLDPENTSISRNHVNITIRGGTFWLQDTSRNGTWVDHQRVYGEAPLKIGSIIAIGENVLAMERA